MHYCNTLEMLMERGLSNKETIIIIGKKLFVVKKMCGQSSGRSDRGQRNIILINSFEQVRRTIKGVELSSRLKLDSLLNQLL